MQYAFKIILVQGFGPLKIKITQFPGGFRLNDWNEPDKRFLSYIKIQLPKRLYWFAYGRPSLVFAFASLISCVEKWQECPIIAQKVLRASFVRAKDPFFKENNRDP